MIVAIQCGPDFLLFFFSRCFLMNSGSLAFCYWKGFNTRQDIRDIPKDSKKHPAESHGLLKDGLGLNYYTP